MRPWGIFLVALLQSGCSDRAESYAPRYSARSEVKVHEYTFAVHPLHNPSLLNRVYRPLVDYLNRNSQGVRFRLVASRDYSAFDQRLRRGEFDFALANPYQGLLAEDRRYRIFGKVAGDDAFRGFIVTRRDGPVHSISDLRGRSVTYPAASAVAAAMLPQRYLQSHGVPLSSTRTSYVGSMESAIRAVETGSSDAAATWAEPWRQYLIAHPSAAHTLQVRWETPHLVNNPLIARDSVPAPVAKLVLKALVSLGTTAAGREILQKIEISGFEPADRRTYAPVQAFLKSFSTSVRPIELPRDRGTRA